MKNKFRLFLILINISIFIISLFLPVFEVDAELFSNKKELLFGYAVLAQGWMAFTGLHFGWLANITWLLSVIFFSFNKYKAGLYLSYASVLLTIDGYFFPSDYFAGFYVWNVAMLSSPFIYLTKQQAITVQKT